MPAAPAARAPAPSISGAPSPAYFAPPAAASAPADFRSTPEFLDAVKSAVVETIKSMKPDEIVTPSGHDLSAIFRQMALSIAEMNDVNAPASAPVRVPPEIAEMRRSAQEEMATLLMEFRVGGRRHNQEWPKYRAIAKTYLNERMIQPFKMGPNKQFVPVEFSWIGEPNDAMKPINEVAGEIFALFKRSRAGAKKVVGQEDKKYWVTPQGLVVTGEAPARREVAADVANDELRLGEGPNDPNAAYVRVLGTVAAPAMQNGQLGTIGVASPTLTHGGPA